jgi:hypothetical protein
VFSMFVKSGEVSTRFRPCMLYANLRSLLFLPMLDEKLIGFCSFFLTALFSLNIHLQNRIKECD